MNTLVAYTSQHGATKKTAELIADLIGEGVTVCNLKRRRPKVEKYDRVILGASIHAGKIQKHMKRFMRKHEAALLERELGLFLSCMHTGQTAKDQLKENFPEVLRKHAKAISVVGGAFDFAQMNFMEKAVVKKVANVNQSVNKLDAKEIENFVKRFVQTEG